MSTQRRMVRKVETPFDRGFDAQFWPVVVAMCVLTATLCGAAIALLDGIMMWVTLMLLPAALGISLAVFRLIEHRMVRRSLQFCDRLQPRVSRVARVDHDRLADLQCGSR